MSDETWKYLHKNPELIDEILANNGKKFPLVVRTEHLIELVVFGAQVDFAPTDSELDKRAIANNYGLRARENLIELMINNAMSLFLVTGYVIEHWRTDAEIEIKAVLSLFKLLDISSALPTTANCLIAIADDMIKNNYLSYQLIEILVHFCNVENRQDIIVEYLIKLLDHRHHRMWTLEAMAELENYPNRLVEKVNLMSNIKNYDEKKQLADMPEREKKIPPRVLDQLDRNHTSNFYSDEELLQVIRESNLKAKRLADNLIQVWGKKRG